MSPKVAIISFLKMVKINGYDLVLKKSIFQKDRERYIAGIFLLGLSKLTGFKYWIRKDNDESPDIRAVWHEKDEKGRKENILNLEIFEWEEHSKVDLLDLIESKLKKKYPTYTILLGYIRGKEGILDLEKYFNKISKIKINIAEIFLLVPILNKKGDHGIFKLYPDRVQIEFFIKETFEKNLKQGDFLKTWRGMGNKSVDLGYYFHEFPKI